MFFKNGEKKVSRVTKYSSHSFLPLKSIEDHYSLTLLHFDKFEWSKKRTHFSYFCCVFEFFFFFFGEQQSFYLCLEFIIQPSANIGVASVCHSHSFEYAHRLCCIIISSRVWLSIICLKKKKKKTFLPLRNVYPWSYFVLCFFFSSSSSSLT